MTKLGRESGVSHLGDIEGNRRTQVGREIIGRLAETLGVDEELLCVGVAGDEIVLKQPENIPGEFLNKVKKLPTLGQRLETLMKYRGETIKGLSKKAKVARSALQRMLRNESRPKVETIVRIATALGADVDVFLEGFYSPKEREEAIRLLGKEKGDGEKPEASLEMAVHIRALLDEAKQPMAAEDILKILQATYDPSITFGDVISVIDGEAELSKHKNLSGEVMVRSARKILQYISECLHLGDKLLRENKFEVARAQFELALSLLRQNQDLFPKEDIATLITWAEDGIKNCEDQMDKTLIITSIAEADPIKRFKITLLRLLEERIRVVNNRLIRSSNGRLVGVDYRQVRRELMQYCNDLIKVAEKNSEYSERLLLQTHIREIWREVHRRIKIFTKELIETTRELARAEYLEGELSTEEATLTSI